MFVNENSSGKIDVKCNYYEKGLTRSERRRLAETNELSSNTLKGVKLHLFDRCKTTCVPKIIF